jgi:hypothetical protein
LIKKIVDPSIQHLFPEKGITVFFRKKKFLITHHEELPVGDRSITIVYEFDIILLLKIVKFFIEEIIISLI